MNISTGISEINLAARANSAGKTQKAYVWPAYNNGIINRINRISDRIASNIYTAKPLTKEDIPGNIMKEAAYNSWGEVKNTPSSYYPGQYLDILA